MERVLTAYDATQLVKNSNGLAATLKNILEHVRSIASLGGTSFKYANKKENQCHDNHLHEALVSLGYRVTFWPGMTQTEFYIEWPAE